MTSSTQGLSPLYSELAVDPDFAEIVEMFVDEMPQRVETLQQHMGHGDREELRRAAHQIKGAAGSYGFNAITPFAARLESVANDETPEEELRTVFDELVEICNRVQTGAPQ